MGWTVMFTLGEVIVTSMRLERPRFMFFPKTPYFAGITPSSVLKYSCPHAMQVKFSNFSPH